MPLPSMAEIQEMYGEGQALVESGQGDWWEDYLPSGGTMTPTQTVWPACSSHASHAD